VCYVPSAVTLGHSTQHLVHGLGDNVLAGEKKTATVNDVNNGAQHSGEYLGRGAARRPVL
jgi:hypothetical protein